MMLVLKIVWVAAVFVVFWAMVGYPVSLRVLDALMKRENARDDAYEPSVTVMVVAYNEERVITEKLQNILNIEYPAEKIDCIVASDCSTDHTDRLVEEFIASHPERKIRLHRSRRHEGKTNAQNEAQELCESEILVMTDANAMLEPNAVRELVSFFSDPSIAYVCGQLRYLNTESSRTANSEGFYWKLDLMCRDIESRIQTITAGNGALYAVRNAEYVKIDPMDCHDSALPVLFALKKRRALYNPAAVACEKAGEVNEDEFRRKVRMSRIVLRFILPDLRILNPFYCRWFSFFYFGHRTCRYLLWLMHAAALLTNIPLAFVGGWFWKAALCMQAVFYAAALAGWITGSGNKLVRIVFYYCMTVTAQWIGVLRTVTGKAVPVWEKAESAR